MQSHELLREVYARSNVKQIAADLGLSLSLVYKWAEPAEALGSGTVNPLDRVETMMRSTGDERIVRWVAERAGGYFIRNPDTLWPDPYFLIPATNQIVKEFADLLAVIATAANDDQISRVEAVAIRARWEDLKSVTETFVRCCEQGNFRQLRQDREPPIRGKRPIAAQ
jgi:hypothetical protein